MVSRREQAEQKNDDITMYNSTPGHPQRSDPSSSLSRLSLAGLLMGTNTVVRGAGIAVLEACTAAPVTEPGTSIRSVMLEMTSHLRPVPVGADGAAIPEAHLHPRANPDCTNVLLVEVILLLSQSSCFCFH